MRQDDATLMKCRKKSLCCTMPKARRDKANASPSQTGRGCALTFSSRSRAADPGWRNKSQQGAFDAPTTILACW
jgi:hypothetical protein